MSILKGKAEGGSGGKRGHSNMDHWVTTEEIKEASRKLRRLEGKRATKQQLASGDSDYCRRCGASWLVPVELTQELLARIADSIREDHRIVGVDLLRHAGFDLGSAKAVVRHMSRNGLCHRCEHTLPPGSHVECTKCGTLNYSWRW